MLTVRPALRALYLLSTPELSIDLVKAVIDRLQLEVHEIFHTDLMKDPFNEEHKEDAEEQEEDNAGFRFILSHYVVEFVWVSVGHGEKRRIDWSKLNFEDKRNRYVCSESNMTYISFSFGDTPLSMTRLLSGLINGTLPTPGLLIFYFHDSRPAEETSQICNIYQ